MSSNKPSQLRLGIAGLGTVGTGLIKLLNAQHAELQSRMGSDFIIYAVSARDPHKDRDIDLKNIKWVTNPLDMADDPEIDIVFELIGGAEGIAKDLVIKALKAGKKVITANKALLARYGDKLAELSQTHNAPLFFEASVAGGIPAINLVRAGMAGDEIKNLGGILNGTGNFILTEMGKNKRSFEDVLKDAQEKGYAEADPSADIDGWDAAHKLAILIAIAFGPIKFDSMDITGIRGIHMEDLSLADKMGYEIKHVAMGEHSFKNEQKEKKISAWVAPCFIRKGAPLSYIHGVNNAVSVTGELTGNITISGAGAGAGPTASAVASDLVAIARKDFYPSIWGMSPLPKMSECLSLKNKKSCFYIRIILNKTVNITEVEQTINHIFIENKLALNNFSHHPQDDGSIWLAALTPTTTYETVEKIKTALSSMNSIDELLILKILQQ